MVSETNAYNLGYTTAPPSTASRRLREWWSRPIATMPGPNGRQATLKELAAYFSPFFGGLLTIAIIFSILSSLDNAQPHAKFSIQSVAVSPSAATWHVDFLVENPSSRYFIYFEDGDASVRLGQENVDVFKITRKHSYRDYTAFSLAFDTESTGNDAVSGELHIKLRGMHKRYADCDEAGHFDITCQNLTRSHENINKITCHSSFTHLNMFV